MPASRIAAAAAMSLLFFAPAAAQPAGQTIALWSFGYSPRPIHLAAGKPVTLTFVNRSGSGHDFTAKRFFASARILSGSVRGGRIELRGGESRSITLFPVAGSYPVHCSHFMHSQFGMQDTIVVH